MVFFKPFFYIQRVHGYAVLWKIDKNYQKKLHARIRMRINNVGKMALLLDEKEKK